MTRFNFIAYTDGGCNNSKRANAYGSFKVFLEDYLVGEERFDLFGIYTSNEAEYATIIALLEWIKDYSQDKKNFHWKIYLDSRLVADTLRGRKRVHAENLIELYQQARDLLKSLKNVELIWISEKVIKKVLGH